MTMGRTEFQQRYQMGLYPEDLDGLAKDDRSYFKRNDFLIKQDNLTDEELV